MTTRNHKHKMHWWVRLYRKLFGKHPGVYIQEDIKTPTGEQAVNLIKSHIDGELAHQCDNINSQIINRVFELGGIKVEQGPKIIQCKSVEEIQRVYNGE